MNKLAHYFKWEKRGVHMREYVIMGSHRGLVWSLIEVLIATLNRGLEIITTLKLTFEHRRTTNVFCFQVYVTEWKKPDITIDNTNSMEDKVPPRWSPIRLKPDCVHCDIVIHTGIVSLNVRSKEKWPTASPLMIRPPTTPPIGSLGGGGSPGCRRSSNILNGWQPISELPKACHELLWGWPNQWIMSCEIQKLKLCDFIPANASASFTCTPRSGVPQGHHDTHARHLHWQPASMLMLIGCHHNRLLLHC